MCDPTESESGQLLTIKPCGWYLTLQSDRDRLAGVVVGMEEQNARNLDAMRQERNSLWKAGVRAVKLQMLAMIWWRDRARKCRDSLRRTEVEAEKHKSRRDHFEDLLNRSITHENEWTKRALAAEAALRDLRATTNNQLAAILVDNGRLRTALLQAVKMYGQPGGPWNVPSEPGAWLGMAKEALGVVDETDGEVGEER